VKHPRRFATGAEPDIATRLHRDAGSTCGKSAFTVEGWRNPGSGDLHPVSAAVVGQEEDEPSVDRVSNDDAVVEVPEGHAIQEAHRVVVGHLKDPTFTCIGGLVDSRLFAGACTQQVGKVGTEAFDVAEVEGFGSGDLSCNPRVSSVHSGRRYVPCVPLAQVTVSDTALTPRRFSRVLLFCSIQRSWA